MSIKNIVPLQAEISLEYMKKNEIIKPRNSKYLWWVEQKWMSHISWNITLKWSYSFCIIYSYGYFIYIFKWNSNSHFITRGTLFGNKLIYIVSLYSSLFEFVNFNPAVEFINEVNWTPLWLRSFHLYLIYRLFH